MNSKGLNILLVSSKPPEHSANLGGDIVKILQSKGCNVDFLTRYPFKKECGCKVYSVFDREHRSASDLLREKLPEFLFKVIEVSFKSIRVCYRKIVYVISKSKELEAYAFKHGFKYPDEVHPPVVNAELLDAIPSGKEYDMIVTLFWEDMINSTSVRALYDRYKAPVYIYSVDMAPMTGGCFYFNSCDHYTKECGQCPCLLSSDKNDRSHRNYLVKRQNYSNADIFYLGNSWMLDKARASKLFTENKLLNFGIIIDENSFYPTSPESARNQLGLSTDKDLIILARSSAEARKGSHILSHAVNYVWDNLSENNRKRFLVLIIGDDTLLKSIRKTGIPALNLGYVNKETLVSAYQVSSLFLNPSTDDAGPSMVNQSIMCGTPVVSYNLGAALDVIENGISGFKTDNISKEAFADTLKSAIDAIVDDSYPQIRETTRKKALEHNTPEVFADKLLRFHFNSF